MKRKIYYICLLIAVATGPYFIQSCEEKPAETSLIEDPLILSVNPESGVEDNEITITGKNFGSNKNAIQVTFGTRTAAITKFSNSELKVRVPLRSNSTVVNVFVAINGRMSNSKVFTYNEIPPSISSLTQTCFYGSKVVIHGNNFSTNTEENIVRFGTIEAPVIQASHTSLTVLTPNLGDAITAEVTVSKAGVVSNAKTITVDVDQNKVTTFNWTTHTLRPGALYKTGELNLFGETLRRVYILDVTLNETNTLGIGFSPSEINTVSMCNNYGAVAGINAGYFPYGTSTDKDPYIRIAGATVQEGHLGVSQLYTNSALLIHNNVAKVRKFTNTGKNLNLVAAAIPTSEAEHIIVCGPMLITSGVIEPLDMSVGHNNSTTARTGLGVTEDGKRVFMVVVDTGGGVTGITTLQLAKILQALGAVNAMNFDGGGSSTMFVKNQGDNGRVNFPTGGTWQRPVRSIVYVK